MKYLTDRHQIYVTDWDTDFRGARDYLSIRYLTNLRPGSSRLDDCTVYHIPRISPAVFSSRLRRMNEAIYKHWIHRIVDRHRIDWVIGSFVLPYEDWGCRVTSDIGDDHTAYWMENMGSPRYAQEIHRNEDSWLTQSSHVTVVSSVLADRIRSRMPSQIPLAVIPNGVDLKIFFPPSNRSTVQQRLGLDPRHRYIGCVGSFNRQSELGRLTATARLIQGLDSVRLILVGSGFVLQQLQKVVREEGLNHVIFAGFQQGRHLTQFFQSIDVGLCPYPVTPGLDASSPLRLLQYSAVGATVVIPSLLEVTRMGFSNIVYSGQSDESFAQAAVAALDVKSDIPAQIQNYDWALLANQFMGLMES